MMGERRWGDRRDGHRVKAPGLQTVMGYLFPRRTESEVYLNLKLDATGLMEYLRVRNEKTPDEKITLFHCALTAVARMIRERPLMNRFIQGYRIYERDEISLSFVAKRRFEDGTEEALMFLVPRETDSLREISARVRGDVEEMRRNEHAEDGLDKTLDTLAALPRPLLALIVRIVRILDFWGKAPKALTDGDPNYSTVLLSNLGSIRCPAVYHHLNNYGTNSIMVTIGALHKEELLMKDGHREVRDVIDFGATLDERIADGFYFARSLKLIQYIFEHPELLERPLSEPSGFQYE